MADQIQIIGVGKLSEALAKAGTYVTEALAAAMVTEMEYTITEAKQRTPVDTGTLRASGTVSAPDVSGSRIEVAGGFGGAAQNYAIPVHERMDARHPVGQAKFLESAFLERASQFPSKLAAGVLAAWQRLAIR